MALLGALCVALNPLGFTNRSLRARVSHLLGAGYTVNQMSYDLARLRSKGLIRRRPGTNIFDLTPEGQRVAIFYTKVHDRLLSPLIAADYRLRHRSTCRDVGVGAPEKHDVVHVIETDDPSGIEAYWHRRLASQRTKGEWFRLSAGDIAAFKRRAYM